MDTTRMNEHTLREDRRFVRSRHNATLSRDGRHVVCLCGFDPGPGSGDSGVADHMVEIFDARVARRREILASCTSADRRMSFARVAHVRPGAATCVSVGPIPGAFSRVHVAIECSDHDLLRVYDLAAEFWDDVSVLAPGRSPSSFLTLVPGYRDVAYRSLVDDADLSIVRWPGIESPFLRSDAFDADADGCWVDLGRVVYPAGGVAAVVVWRGEDAANVTIRIAVELDPESGGG